MAQVLSELGESSPMFGSTIKKFCEMCKDLTKAAYDDRMPSLETTEAIQELRKRAQEDLRKFLEDRDPEWHWKDQLFEVGHSRGRKVFKVKGETAGEQAKGEGDQGGRQRWLRWCLCQCSSLAKVASEDAAAEG